MTERDSPEVLARFQGELPLVDIVARQLLRDVGRVLDLDDLRALGQMGLLEAARRFDPARGVPFRKFANYRVRGAMIDGMRKSQGLPRRAYARLRAMESAMLVAEVKTEDGATGPAPTPAEAEKKLDAHLADMATAMAMGLLAPTAMGEDGERVAVSAEEANDDRLGTEQLLVLVREAAKDLPDQERQLIERHYFGGERFDLVSASLGLSKSWGSRLHTRALQRLAEKLRGAAG